MLKKKAAGKRWVMTAGWDVWIFFPNGYFHLQFAIATKTVKSPLKVRKQDDFDGSRLRGWKYNCVHAGMQQKCERVAEAQQMELFLTLSGLSQVSMWWRAHRKSLGVEANHQSTASKSDLLHLGWVTWGFLVAHASLLVMQVDWLSAYYRWLADPDFQRWHLSFPAAARGYRCGVCLLASWSGALLQNAGQSDPSFPPRGRLTVCCWWLPRNRGMAAANCPDADWCRAVQRRSFALMCFSVVSLCAAVSETLIQAVTHGNFNTLEPAVEQTLVFLRHINCHWINPECHLWNL